MIPRQRFKLGGDYSVNKNFGIGADLLVVGSQYYAGDEFNWFEKLPAYAVVYLSASYQVTAPFTDPRSLSPAQPRSVYAGLKATF